MECSLKFEHNPSGYIYRLFNLSLKRNWLEGEAPLSRLGCVEEKMVGALIGESWMTSVYHNMVRQVLNFHEVCYCHNLILLLLLSRFKFSSLDDDSLKELVVFYHPVVSTKIVVFFNGFDSKLGDHS